MPYSVKFVGGSMWCILQGDKILFTGTYREVEDYLDWLENHQPTAA